MANATCSIDGCDWGGRLRRGMCNAHYFRWYRTGDPGPGIITDPRRTALKCQVPDCGNPHVAFGCCQMHYIRLKKHGDPLVTVPNKGADAWNWSGEEPSYTALHKRIRRWLGPARERACLYCGRQAQAWAYDHTDPDEMFDEEQGYYYSTDPAKYIALCWPCHTPFDKKAKAYRCGLAPTPGMKSRG